MIATIRTGNFRYVAYHLVDDYHRKGWMVVAHLGATHGQYAVLMWKCDCEDGHDDVESPGS
jgi:hypothetical protein